MKITQEVIFLDVTDHLVQQKFLLQQINVFKGQGIFDNDLPEKYIPSGPARRDPNIVPMADSEGKKQILRHNPTLTQKELDKAYKLIENMGKRSIDESKKVQLDKITSHFFKNEAPAHWRSYPSERVTGKYQGHQILFFTLPVAYTTKTVSFSQALIQDGFAAELRKTKEKDSIIVDLTMSKFTI